MTAQRQEHCFMCTRPWKCPVKGLLNYTILQSRLWLPSDRYVTLKSRQHFPLSFAVSALTVLPVRWSDSWRPAPSSTGCKLRGGVETSRLNQCMKFLRKREDTCRSCSLDRPPRIPSPKTEVMMTADGERKAFKLPWGSRCCLPPEGEGGGENMLRQQGLQLWADGVMKASSRTPPPPAENNNHNKDCNNDDNEKPKMSQTAAAATNPMNIRQRAEWNKDTFRHVFLPDFILSLASRCSCPAGDVRNELQRPITHLTAEREISFYQFSLAGFLVFFKGEVPCFLFPIKKQNICTIMSLHCFQRC